MAGDQARPQPHPAPSVTPLEDVAALYSRAAPAYAEQGPPFFAHAGQRLVDLAQPQPGDAVLDLATGRGAVLLPAARRVGPGGRAVGIDFSPGMLEHTQRALQRLGLVQASLQHMNAEHLAFPAASFSHVLCSFAIFLFADPERVLHEVRRVLRPAGLVGFAFSRGTDPRWTWYEDLLRRHGAFEGLPPQPGQPSLRQPGVLLQALRAAGFDHLQEIEEPTDFRYPSVEAWWSSLWTHGSRRPLERLQPAVLARIQAECLARARDLLTPDGLPERMTLVYVLAQAPPV